MMAVHFNAELRTAELSGSSGQDSKLSNTADLASGVGKEETLVDMRLPKLQERLR